MTTTIVIRSPRPNNHTVAVLSQVLDPTGAPCGDPSLKAVLDDGDELVATVGPNECLVLVEKPRNSAPIAAVGTPAPPAPGDAAARPDAAALPPAIGSGGAPVAEEAA